MTEETVSPLRRRMIEDMTIRRFSNKTQADYIRPSRPSPTSSARCRPGPAPRICAAGTFT
jgi:hypothetical protein